MSGGDTPGGGNGQKPRTGGTGWADTMKCSTGAGDAADLVALLDTLTSARPGFDVDAFLAVLAVVVTARTRGEVPLWLMLIAPPSFGKTSALDLVAKCGSQQAPIQSLSSLTEAGLLTGSPRREWAAEATGGVLKSIKPDMHGLIFMPDLSGLLGMANEKRTAVLAAFRHVHDGEYARALGADGAATVRWSGRVSVVAAGTPVVDRHHGVDAELGDRFVRIRLSGVDEDAQARAALRGVPIDELAKQVERFVDGQLARAVGPRSVDEDLLVDLARFGARLRSAVLRDGKTRDIIARPVPEAPARLVKVMKTLDEALSRIGCGAATRRGVALRIALDSASPVRRDIVLALAKSDKGSLATTALVAATGVAETTTKRACEDLQALGLLAGERDAGAPWRLDPEWAAVLARLLAL
jgi:hypothetical protein